MLALWLSAWGVAHTPVEGGPDRLSWIVVLCVQSVPYASSLVVSLLSAFSFPARLLGTGYSHSGKLYGFDSAFEASQRVKVTTDGDILAPVSPGASATDTGR